MTIEKLSELMGGQDRSRIVNWMYIARTQGPTLPSKSYPLPPRVQIADSKPFPTGEARTIEFRQHAGTLSPLAVAHWTTFVVGLVRLAEHNSRLYNAAPGYDGAGYRYRERSDGVTVWEVMEMMELEEREVGYWRGVVGGWA